MFVCERGSRQQMVYKRRTVTTIKCAINDERKAMRANVSFRHLVFYLCLFLYIYIRLPVANDNATARLAGSVGGIDFSCIHGHFAWRLKPDGTLILVQVRVCGTAAAMHSLHLCRDLCAPCHLGWSSSAYYLSVRRVCTSIRGNE